MYYVPIVDKGVEVLISTTYLEEIKAVVLL